MPKVAVPSIPISGLFGIVKPSGPTSMDVVNKLKGLIMQSRLFVDADKLANQQNQKKNNWKGRKGRDSVKIGQGGTLDPLADGVLGESYC